jgi:hypothetical protein
VKGNMELTFDAGTTIEGKPFVRVLIDDKQVGQLDPIDAQMLGLRAIKSAIEAERDAGFLSFMLSMDDSREGVVMAGAMLHGLRENRQQADPENPIYKNDPRMK